MNINNTLAGPNGTNATLRNLVGDLQRAGLSYDEALWVAHRRLGGTDAKAGRAARTELVVAFALAILAAVAIKVPELVFGLAWEGPDLPFLMRNVGFMVLPFLVGYFAWKRRLGIGASAVLVGGFAVAALFANVYPLDAKADTLKLTVLHLPIALWLLVGLAHAGGRWRDAAARMDFVRFSGELFIYYALIAMGGGVFVALNLGIFQAIGIDAERAVEFLLPCGMAGAVVVAAWLVETKQRVMENMAEPIGNIAAGALLGFFVEEIGATIYNRAVRDVQERLQARVMEVDIEIHEEEFQYWRKYEKQAKGRK